MVYHIVLSLKLDTAMDVVSEFEEINVTNKIEIPEVVEERVVEQKAEIVREDLYFDDEKVYEDQNPIEKQVEFYERQPLPNMDYNEHQEIPQDKELVQVKDVLLQAEELTSERDLQSIAAVRMDVKSELVECVVSLPDKFAEYSLLSVEDKVKHYNMTGKEEAYAMVEAYFKRIGHVLPVATHFFNLNICYRKIA